MNCCNCTGFRSSQANGSSVGALARQRRFIDIRIADIEGDLQALEKVPAINGTGPQYKLLRNLLCFQCLLFWRGRSFFDTQGQKIYHARRVTLQIDKNCNTKCAPASIEDRARPADIKHIRSYVLCPDSRNMEYFQKSSEILKSIG